VYRAGSIGAANDGDGDPFLLSTVISISHLFVPNRSRKQTSRKAPSRGRSQERRIGQLRGGRRGRAANSSRVARRSWIFTMSASAATSYSMSALLPKAISNCQVVSARATASVSDTHRIQARWGVVTTSATCPGTNSVRQGFDRESPVVEVLENADGAYQCKTKAR
jgi:hypothetical protein